MSRRVYKRLPELRPLQTYGLISNGDSAPGEQLLDIPETEPEAMREPYDIRNNLGGKSVATIVWISDAPGGLIAVSLAKLIVPVEISIAVSQRGMVSSECWSKQNTL
jgi:hypothetical protein